ncbi:SagB/ThcOx family dehydrogenase [bacterium]|nr:SagB/ThcOx family dehydrogenase [bacterium]
MSRSIFIPICLFLLITSPLIAVVIFEDDFTDPNYTKAQFRFDETDKGKYTIEDGYLEMNDNKKADGIYYTCDINLSTDWDNYILNTDLDIGMGEGGIIFRNDGTNLYFIEFVPSSKVIHFKMRDSEGVNNSIQDNISVSTLDFSKKIKLNLIVNESYLVLNIDDNNILRTSLPKSGPTTGKVGLFSWAENAPQSIVKFHNISVLELSCPIIEISSDKSFYITGDSISLSYNIENPCPSSKADLYFAVLLPTMKISFYNGNQKAWENFPVTASPNMEIPRFDHLEVSDYVDIPLPSTNPPINTAGSYTFAAALTKPGTVEFYSDIATCSVYYSGSDKKEIPLLQPDFTGSISVEEAIKTRRTIRTFSSTPLTFKQISQLAWAGLGITEEGTGAFKRAAPSAGALYPIDVFFVIGDNCVEGMMAGIYKYIPQNHTFEFIRGEDQRIPIAEACLYQMFQAEAPINIVMTAQYSRSTVKYGDRGVQYSHMEVGHIGQNLLLQGVAMGLNTCIIGAFYDDIMQDILQVPDDYIPMIVLSLGH